MNLKIKVLFFLLLSFTLLYGQNQSKLIVAGFYPFSKSTILKPADIHFDKLTHLIYCFAWPMPDGSLQTQSEHYHNKTLIKRAHMKGCKVIVMIGGGGAHSDGFHEMASGATEREKFVSSLVSWCIKYGYDGVNLDWEYPGNNDKAEDRENLSLLVKELHEAFARFKIKTGKSLEISMDVHSMLDHARWIDYKLLSNYMDWFGIMTYDYSGEWQSSEHASHNAPLFCGPAEICNRYLCVDRGFHNFKDSLQVSSSKLVLGVPFYGRKFDNKALYDTPKRGGDGIAYYDVSSLVGNGWSRYWDDQSKVPYLLKDDGNGLISYDDPTSLNYKIDYIKENKAAGVMIWEITQDIEKNKKQPLLEAINESIQ